MVSGSSEVVEACYRALLLRAADLDGLQHFVPLLESKELSLEEFLRLILNCREFANHLPRFLTHYNLASSTQIPCSFNAADADSVAVWGDLGDFSGLIARHPGWRGRSLADPDLDLHQPVIFHTEDDDDRERLRERGIAVQGGKRFSNLVVCDASTTGLSSTIHIEDTRGNIFLLSANCQLRGNISVSGNNNLCVCLGRKGHAQNYHVWLYGHENAFIFGKGSTSFGTIFYVEGPKHHIVVSEDCMFSEGIVVTGTDHHAILEYDTGNVINQPRDVVLEPHSWIGLGATILKGVKVGRGAIIAARSVVTRDVPPLTLVAGAPAKILRSNVTWTREPASFFDQKRITIAPDFSFSTRDSTAEPLLTEAARL